MSRKFKAPPHDDLDQWEKVRLLAAHGLHFESIRDESGAVVPYPKTLKEARVFVRIHGRAGSQARLIDDTAPKRRKLTK